MIDEIYVQFVDAEGKLTDTIRQALVDAMKSRDTKRMKQIHSRLAKLASDVTNPEWLQPKGKNDE